MTASRSAPLVKPSPGFAAWLQQQRLSLAITTYRANRLLLLGSSPEQGGRLKLNERLFDRPMGLFLSGGSLWMAGRSHLWRFDNLLEPGAVFEGGDQLYVPAMSCLTGEVNAHELVVDSQGRLVFVNTAFSCLAGLRSGVSFEPLWQPPYIDQLQPQDRCHLNGVALRDGQLQSVTACGQINEPAGWRRQRHGGGVVIDVPSGELVLQGLSMPHSPRWHQDRLWVLNSGLGELGYVEEGRLEVVCQLPGFARGLAFHGGYALVGLSQLRSKQFTGLPLEERLHAEGRPQGCCGVAVVNLSSGEQEHLLELNRPIDELFDLAVLPGVQRPRALGLRDGLSDNLVKLPGQQDFVLIKPSLPSGQPHQGPEVPRLGIPEAALARSASSSTSVTTASAELRYQKIYELTETTLQPYSALTCPSLALGSAALAAVSGELYGLCAMAGTTMVGLAIAEATGSGEARLLSLMVLPPWRGGGIGTRLVGHLMVFLKAEQISTLKAGLDQPDVDQAALKRLLERLKWAVDAASATAQVELR